MNVKPAMLLKAAVPVVLGVILLNNIRSLAGNTAIGKLISGDLVRRV